MFMIRVTRTEGGHRRHRHRHGASGSKDDVPYWQHIGSNVELDTITPVGQPDLDEATALADGDIENITSTYSIHARTHTDC